MSSFHGILGGLRNFNFRGLAWRIMLGVLNPNDSYETWIDTLNQDRERYRSIKNTVKNDLTKVWMIILM